MNYETMTLKEIKDFFTNLASQWNGKTTEGEDAFNQANDILDIITSLENMIKNYEF